MPLYDYLCTSCGAVEEVLQKPTDPSPDQCHICQTPGKMVKEMAAAVFVLKDDGVGWAKDSYSKLPAASNAGE